MPLLEINFSEEHARRVRKAMPRKHVPTALGVVIASVLMLLAVFYLYLFSREGTLTRQKRALEELEGRAKEAVALEALREELAEKVGVLEKWERERLRLAPCWLELARVTPEAIYVTRIEVSGDRADAGPERMLIRGRAMGVGSEAAVLRLLSDLKRAEVFTSSFALVTLTGISTEGDEKVFSIECVRRK
ncbi:MAG: PilN domain-containing protein [bacterium]|nr:PilN domain-containing protein [bacterium]